MLARRVGAVLLWAAMLTMVATRSADAAAVAEGIPEAKGRVLLNTIAQRIEQFSPGRLDISEIDYVAPAPVGKGLYLVSARRGRFVAVVDERVTNVMVLAHYVSTSDGKRTDMLARVREKVSATQPPEIPATSGRPMLRPENAITYGDSTRMIQVFSDPNGPDSIRFHNEVLKQTPNVKAFIHPVSIAAPGNYREGLVREVLCWPEAMRFEKWDEVINDAPPGTPGPTCSRAAQLEANGDMLRNAGIVELPMLVLRNGATVPAAGMTPEEFDRVLNRNAAMPAWR